MDVLWAEDMGRGQGKRYVYTANEADILSGGSKEEKEARKTLIEMDKDDEATDQWKLTLDTRSVCIPPRDAPSENQALSAPNKRPHLTESVHEPHSSNLTRQKKKPCAEEFQLDYEAEILKVREQVRGLEEVVEGDMTNTSIRCQG